MSDEGILSPHRAARFACLAATAMEAAVSVYEGPSGSLPWSSTGGLLHTIAVSV
jgi:hypothetical protein